MYKESLITIVLTTFNRAHLIGETLDSIIAQTYENWECIIIDDSSKDNTKEVVDVYLKKEDRFIFLTKPPEILKGLPASRNIGIEIAKGKYIVFFDDDDIVHPELLAKCITEFNENKKIDFVHYRKQAFEGRFKKKMLLSSLDNNKDFLKGNLYENVILGEIALASCTVMWKIDLLKHNKFNEDLMYAEEWECYSRIFIKNNLIGVFIKSPLYFNRKHDNSNTGEFWKNDSIRMFSYVKAQQIVCENIVELNLMTKKLNNYFFHKAYILKSKMIVSKLLEQSFMNKVYFWMYPLKFNLYKFLKQFLKQF